MRETAKGNLWSAIREVDRDDRITALESGDLSVVTTDATLDGDGTIASPLTVLSAPTGSTAVAVAASLTGNGKTGTPLVVASAPTGSTGVAINTHSSLTGDGKTGTGLAVRVATADDFANDGAAATGGIPVGGLYHTSGTVKVRLA